MTKSLFAGFILSAITVGFGIDTAGSVDSKPALEEAATPALRVKTDPARGRRWELGWGTVTVYDVASGLRERTLRLPGATLSGAAGSCIPDMVLGRSGALYVSSNVEPRIWRISPARFEVEVYDIALDADQDKDVGFSSLAWNEDEKTLYAVTPHSGASWRVDMRSATATRIGVSQEGRSC